MKRKSEFAQDDIRMNVEKYLKKTFGEMKFVFNKDIEKYANVEVYGFKSIQVLVLHCEGFIYYKY